MATPRWPEGRVAERAAPSAARDARPPVERAAERAAVPAARALRLPMDWAAERAALEAARPQGRECARDRRARRGRAVGRKLAAAWQAGWWSAQAAPVVERTDHMAGLVGGPAATWRQRAVDLEMASECEREQVTCLMEVELSTALQDAERA